MIKIRIDDRSITEKIRTLKTLADDMSPVMRILGERVLRQTEDRFNRQGPSPDGTPRPPLTSSTRQRKRHPKILTESGHLRGSIRYQLIGKRRVSIGTNKVYAAIHQLGGKTPPRTILPIRKKALFWPGAAHPVKSVQHPGSLIPARPFLGISRENSEELVGIINRYIAERLER